MGSPLVKVQAFRACRPHFLPGCLVEQLCPVVEGVLSEQELAHDLVTYCNRLKGLPFGVVLKYCDALDGPIDIQAKRCCTKTNVLWKET